MLEVYEFLKSAGTYYLATMDGDQPRVRPFGTRTVSSSSISSFATSPRGRALPRMWSCCRNW